MDPFIPQMLNDNQEIKCIPEVMPNPMFQVTKVVTPRRPIGNQDPECHSWAHYITFGVVVEMLHNICVIML